MFKKNKNRVVIFRAEKYQKGEKKKRKSIAKQYLKIYHNYNL